MAEPARTLLTGWGRTAPTAATLWCVRDRDEVARLVVAAPARGITARGLGRSYGDAAQNAGGVVLDLTGLTRIVAFDVDSGRLHAEAGLSIGELLRRVLPVGWTVPVTPGTRSVTLGGAFAADIHGKNHHRDGAFAEHVTGITLVTPDGEPRWVTPDREPRLFWATAGGMGLTGVITTVQLRLHRVASAWMRVDTERARDLDELLDRLSRGDADAEHSVAWLDATARGARLGRGVVTRGWHATTDELPDTVTEPLRPPEEVRATVPDRMPRGLLNRASIRVLDGLWYRRAPRVRQEELQPLGRFFHPLDGVREWNRLYGPRGLLQYQFVVPFDATATLRRVVERLATSGIAAPLTVLKRFGPGDPGPLSFPVEGWTLAVDLPNVSGVADLLDDLDDLVVTAGGRPYLAKDARTRPEVLRAAYPRLDEFLAVRTEVDPHGRLTSDLARRLAL